MTDKVKFIDPNIGLGEAQKAVADLLNHRLADIVMLYFKTRNYHWNVTGMHFAELHEFFEEQYDQLEEAMDEVAERVRQVGGIAIGTLSEVQQHAALKEEPGVVPTAEEMVRNLLSDHEAVIRQLRADVDATAEQYNDMGTSDFLTALMEKHEKMAWMLRAHLEG
ncbi:MAG: DNA starvation/stationary phase protection protein [Phototrophicales bacterium]|nr:MAG: DNA starvation/stationary phase protection protein [Phototrophicales bacterium]